LRGKTMKRLTMFFLLLAMIGQAWAAELTPWTPKGPYYPDGIHAGDLAFTWTAADGVNDCTFTCLGRELLLMHNTGESAVAATCTIQSITDEYGTRGDLRPTIAAGETACFWFGNKRGWDNGAGVTIESSTTVISYSVARFNPPRRRYSPASATAYYESSEVVGPYPTTAQALVLGVTMSAAYSSLTESTFLNTGGDLVIVHNTDVAVMDVAFLGRRNEYNRLLTISGYMVPADGWAAFLFSDARGWADGNGHTAVYSTDADVEIGVLNLPD
jgi:hypothetical protein